MNKTKKLLVTAKYGSLEFSETAIPYNKNALDEQAETCVESICQQIADAGREEMMDAFQLTSELIEQSLTSISQDGVMSAPPWDNIKQNTKGLNINTTEALARASNQS